MTGSFCGSCFDKMLGGEGGSVRKSGSRELRFRATAVTQARDGGA